MQKWYVFEFDSRNEVTVYDGFRKAQYHCDTKHWHREGKELYSNGRIWMGTKQSLIKNGFDNVRFEN